MIPATIPLQIPISPHAAGTRRSASCMRGARTVLLLALASVLPCGAAAPSAEEQIRQVEAGINAAYAANDLPRYFAAYDDNLRALFPDGPITLGRYRKEWTEFIQAGGGIVGFDYGDLVIQVAPSEDAAVASYRATVRTRGIDGKITQENYLETDVFFRRDKDWKIVEIHYSPVAAPAR